MDSSAVSEYILSPTACLRATLHAAKHASEAVNGVLLGEKSDDRVTIVAAQPILHGQLGLSPMMEVALMQIDAHVKLSGNDNIGVVGYYQANCLVDDMDLGVAGSRIADRIQSKCPFACVLMLDNRLLHPSVRKDTTAWSLLVRPSSQGPWVAPTPTIPLHIPSINATLLRLHDILNQNNTHQSFPYDLSSLHDFDDHLNHPMYSWLTHLLPDSTAS